MKELKIDREKLEKVAGDEKYYGEKKSGIERKWKTKDR